MFNAFVIISLSGVVGVALMTALPEWVKISCLGLLFAFAGVLALWVNWVARKDPRSATYGPNEYLEESRLEHERRLRNLG